MIIPDFKNANSIEDMIEQLEQGNSEDKSLSKILYHVRKGSQEIQVKDEEAILLFGNTGSGKTTLAALLAGLDLSIKLNSDDEYYLDYNNEDNQKYGKIGNDYTNSKTFIPNKFSNHSQHPSLVIWDNPGFGDSRGEDIDIVNSYYMHKILDNSTNIKLIFLIDGPSFERQGFGVQNGEFNKQLFETLYQITRGSQIDFSQNLILIFTKTSKGLPYFREKLVQFFSSLLKCSEYLEKLQKYFFMKNPKSFYDKVIQAQILTFPAPKEEENDQNYNNENRLLLQRFINRSSFYQGKDLQIPFTIKCLDNIKRLWQYSKNSVSETFDSLCNDIASLIKEFNKEQFIETEKVIKKYEGLSLLATNTNKENFSILMRNLIEPIIQQFSQNQETLDIYNSNDFDLNLSKKIERIEFFLYEIYDGLLNKVNLSEQTNEFLGKFDCYETKKGITTLTLTFNNYYQKFLKQQELEEKKILIETQKSTIQNLSLENDEKERRIEQLNSEIEEIQKQKAANYKMIEDLKHQIQIQQNLIEQERIKIRQIQEQCMAEQIRSQKRRSIFSQLVSFFVNVGIKSILS